MQLKRFVKPVLFFKLKFSQISKGFFTLNDFVPCKMRCREWGTEMVRLRRTFLFSLHKRRVGSPQGYVHSKRFLKEGSHWYQMYFECEGFFITFAMLNWNGTLVLLINNKKWRLQSIKCWRKIFRISNKC